jgi:hypothetical protein
VLHIWEHTDPRLLVCEAFLFHNSTDKITTNVTDQNEETDFAGPVSVNSKFAESAYAWLLYFFFYTSKPECLVISMFFNNEVGLLVNDSYPRNDIYSKLISVQIPYHFFVTKVLLKF